MSKPASVANLLRPATLFFIGSVTLTSAIIYGVFYSEEKERRRRRAGVQYYMEKAERNNTNGT